MSIIYPLTGGIKTWLAHH